MEPGHDDPGFLIQFSGAIRLALPMPHNVDGALVLREVVHC